MKNGLKDSDAEFIGGRELGNAPGFKLATSEYFEDMSRDAVDRGEAAGVLLRLDDLSEEAAAGRTGLHPERRLPDVGPRGEETARLSLLSVAEIRTRLSGTERSRCRKR